MNNIDEYIKESFKMENVSDGGSECFDFGNVVLVNIKFLLNIMLLLERMKN